MSEIKIRVILINEENGEEIFNEIPEDINYRMDADLANAPYAVSHSLGPLAKYSKGTYITITGYIKNEKINEELEWAMKQNGLK